MRVNVWETLAILLIGACTALAGCDRRPPRASPPGFADLPPVPGEREFGSPDAERLAWRERMEDVYKALGPDAHWKLKEERRVVFRMKDLPSEQQETLAEYVRGRHRRGWVESKVGRPPDLSRLSFAFWGSPGGTVTLAILDPRAPQSGGLQCAEIGGWPEEEAAESK